MKKFRVSYTYAAYEGGMDTYWSCEFSKSGVWFEKWNAPLADTHEDVWYVPEMIWKGYVFWPHDVPEPLTPLERRYLWPGLSGRPNDSDEDEEEEEEEEEEDGTADAHDYLL